MFLKYKKSLRRYGSGWGALTSPIFVIDNTERDKLLLRVSHCMWPTPTSDSSPFEQTNYGNLTCGFGKFSIGDKNFVLGRSLPFRDKKRHFVAKVAGLETNVSSGQFSAIFPSV